MWQEYTFGDCDIVVCHIDSGEPITSNSWYNPGEYAGVTGVDDDGNGARIIKAAIGDSIQVPSKQVQSVESPF